MNSGMNTGTPTANSGKWARRGRRLWWALRDSLQKLYTEDSLAVAASIAYYTVLSIFPFLLLVLALTGSFISHFHLTGRLTPILNRILPMRPDFILQNLQVITKAYGRLGFASFLLLLWSSAGVFLPIEKWLNRAWEVAKVRSWLRRRLLALEMALIFGLLTMVLSGLLGLNIYTHPWLQSLAEHHTGLLLRAGYRVLLAAAGFLLTLAVFILLFKRLPNRRMEWREVLPGALFTAVLWQIARGIFIFLLRRFNYRHVYGSIGAMVALMTWAYFSSVVMLFGAQVSNSLYIIFQSTRRSQGTTHR
jgi:membrane protein